MREQPYDLLDSQIDRRVDLLATQLQIPVTPEGLDALSRSDSQLRIRVADVKGHKVWQSTLAGQAGLPLRRQEGGYTVRLRIPSDQGKGPARYLGADDDKDLSDEIAFRMKERDIVIDAATYRVQVALPMVKMDEEIRELMGALILVMVASTLLLVLLSNFVACRILNPVNQINRLAREIDQKTMG